MELVVTNKKEVSKLLKSNYENELNSEILKLDVEISESELYKRKKELEKQLLEFKEDKKALIDIIQTNMIANDVKEFEENGVKFKLKKREGVFSVDVKDIKLVDKKYIAVKTTETVDKIKAKKDMLENGEFIEGLELVKGATTYTLDVEIVSVSKEDIIEIEGRNG